MDRGNVNQAIQQPLRRSLPLYKRRHPQRNSSSSASLQALRRVPRSDIFCKLIHSNAQHANAPSCPGQRSPVPPDHPHILSSVCSPRERPDEESTARSPPARVHGSGRPGEASTSAHPWRPAMHHPHTSISGLVLRQSDAVLCLHHFVLGLHGRGNARHFQATTQKTQRLIATPAVLVMDRTPGCH